MPECSNDERGRSSRPSSFGHSGLIRHSGFVIRHSAAADSLRGRLVSRGGGVVVAGGGGVGGAGDGVEELGGGDGLDEVGGEAGAAGAFEVFVGAEAGEGDGRDV